MSTSTFKYTLIVNLFCLCIIAQAQDKTNPQQPVPTNGTPAPASGTLIEEIEIVRPYKPVLADAVKIRRNPDLKNEAPFKPVLRYNIIDKKLNLNSNIKELEAQKVAEEQQNVQNHNYVKIGAGNFNTALGEVYVNTGNDEALQTGAFFRHISQQGSLDKQQFSNQELGVFGRSITDDFALSGKLIYDRKSSFYYGFDPVAAAPIDMSKQRFSNLAVEGEIISNYSESSSFDYSANLSAYQFSNIDDARESSVLLKTYLNKEINKLNLGLNASADFTTTKDIAYKIGNNILRANPYLKIKSNSFELNIGANIVQEFGSTSRLNIFPAISAELPIIPGYASLFAGVNGDVLKGTLKDLATENPFLSKNIGIQNTLEKMNVYAGIKGNASAEFGYKVMAWYKTMEDFQLFINNPALINRFDAIYDKGQSEIFGIEGEVNLRASDVITLSGKAQIFNYKLATETDAWFKPNLRVTSNARAQVNQKVFIDAELLFQSESLARLNAPGGGFAYRTVKSFIDLSAGAEYSVNKNIGVYIRANNMLGQSYQRYLYYPKLGLTLLGGVNYKF